MADQHSPQAARYTEAQYATRDRCYTCYDARSKRHVYNCHRLGLFLLGFCPSTWIPTDNTHHGCVQLEDHAGRCKCWCGHVAHS